MEISRRLLRELQTRLKVGNRGSVLLNAIPGKSKYKLDLKRLSIIKKTIPENFLKELLSNPNFSFKISWKDRDDYDSLSKKEKQHFYAIKESLDSLLSQTEVTESEKGINTFGFGFPILVRRDQKDNELTAAPIIIWSLNIERKRELNTWVISRNETDAIYVNEVLINHLLFDSNVEIEKISPEMLEDGIIDKEEIISLCIEIIKAVNVQFPDESEKSIRELFSRIEFIPTKDKLESLVRIPNQSILFAGGLFSIFEIQKQSLIRDYDCLLSKERVQLGTGNMEDKGFQSLTSIETDPTQQGILDSMRILRNILIQGPPGTGKSQTLTGIILNSLENGKKVLVVCEKRTALEVLEEALNDKQLGKYCVLIKDIFKDRRKVVDSVRERIEGAQYNRYTYSRSKKSLDKLIEASINLIEKINIHHTKLTEELLEGKNWTFWVGERLRTLKELPDQETLDFSKFNFEYSDKEFNELLKITSEGEPLYEEYKSVENFNFINREVLKGDNPFILEKKLRGLLHDYTEEIKGKDSRIREIVESNKNNPDFFDVETTRKFGYRFSALFNRQKRETLKNQIRLFKLCSKLAEKIEADEWIDYNIDKTSHESIFRGINSLLEESSKFFLTGRNVFLNTFRWITFYRNLNDLQKDTVNSLKLKKDWKSITVVNYLNSLLTVNASNKLLSDDDYLERLRINLGNINNEQIRFIDRYWFSREMDSASSFDENDSDVRVKNLFNKRASSKHKRLSLRKIVETDIDLFTSFFPVILTTPDICSNLFEDKCEYFDVVLFDEASQLKLEDTLPAMLKGKQVIVAGDEHQMPPSNYFSKVLGGEIEDEIDVDEDVPELNKKVDVVENLLECESLLEASDQLGFEERFLEFHYRSRHPYLIDFSNHAFYHSRLKPVPNNVNYIPIKLVQVDGTYSGYTNDLEADSVISILENEISRFPDGQYPSVGIATFNIHQRNLIKSKIQDRRRDSDTFNVRITELEKAGLFVKNLENIQGDERDIIILSTTFGIDKDGKFSERFGPIIQKKGYRLFNVLITRAKYKVFVCTSIPQSRYLSFKERLISENSNNRQAVFYSYLAYSKAVSENDLILREDVLKALDNNSVRKETINFRSGSLESPFEEEVYDVLIRNFNEEKIIPQLKFGGFRIDMVYDPQIDGVPLIAIECDGCKYHSSEQAYLYDLHRQRILESHGFVFHRIWSTNWWQNPKKEIQRLIDFIRKVEQGGKNSTRKTSQFKEVIFKN